MPGASLTPGPGGFSQPGSIVRLKFNNFMQYTDTEFKAGPNLNVIIGPNGSGKSTIVNGICLGLAGKPSVLGRASTMADFVKQGEQQAMVEVELFVPDGENVVIGRRWDMSNKTVWTIGGNKVSEKEVKKLVAHFRIQVDNLCQFLPQDKVHDFSRQNSKGLLDSTVDAVGDSGLKDKHLELKELQKSLHEGDELFDRKKQMLKERTEQCQRLEEEVKAFEEKRTIEKKIGLLEGRLAWSKVREVQRETRAKKDAKEAKEKHLGKEEAKMNPLKKVLNEAKQKKQNIEAKLVTDNAKVKESRSKAQSHSKNIERLEEKVRGLADELEEVDQREEEKQENIRKSRHQIAELEAEFSTMEQEGEAVGPQQLEEARRRAQDRQRAVEDKQAERENVHYSRRGVQQSLVGLQQDLAELNNVDNQKMQVLRKHNDDAFKASMWLRDHREQFQGEVFEPFIICGNVADPSNSVYVENSVNMRDLTAFFFTDTGDMNSFLRTTRQDKGWKKVSAVLIPDRDSASFVPEVPASSLQQLGLVSYVREMVAAPDGVLAFMCANYHIHRVAVFKPQAEKHNDRFVDEFRLNKFFLGSKLQTVSGSRYSSAKTTMTRSVNPMGVLQVSLDTERAARLEGSIQARQQEEVELGHRLQQQEEELRGLNTELEAARKEGKALEQRKNYKVKAGTRIEAEKRNLRAIMAEANFEEERAAKRAAVKPSVKQMAVSVQQLQAAIGEVERGQLAIELARLANRPMDQLVEERAAALEAARASLRGLQEELAAATAALDESKQELAAACREARQATNSSGNEPPAALAEKWEEEKLPAQREAIEVMAAELQAQADCMEAVDPAVVRQYQDLKETIQELERDIGRREQQQRDSEQQMEEVKAAWLASLNELVTRINTRFSAHFSSMGFAGQVLLHTGQFENDFENYGVDIMVKYRDSEPLQKLTASHQSGGERSVATALYMLALQELTTVPFRCVDEINQGMDATNERRVFELLVRTSCHENSAQYFLLTPKLLSGLDYSPRMNVLIVNNGPRMCHHSQWRMDLFHQAVARQA